MKEEKSLHFVQCGSTLLQCDSVFCYRCPPLGVSSLDLGRLFIQAALFSISITGGRPHRVNPTTVVEIVQRASSDHVSSGGGRKGPRHGQGGVQGRVEGAEGQNLEGRACGSLQGNEYSGQWVTRRTRLRAFEHAVGGKMQPQKAEADQADGKPHPQGYSLRLFHVGSVDKKPSPTGAGGW
jgi:hypothetical protein